MKWAKTKVVYVRYCVHTQDCSFSIWSKPGSGWKLRIIHKWTEHWGDLPALGEPPKSWPHKDRPYCRPDGDGIVFENTYCSVRQAKRAAKQWLEKLIR